MGGWGGAAGPVESGGAEGYVVQGTARRVVDVHGGEVSDDLGRSLNVRNALGGLDPAGSRSSLMGMGEGTSCSAERWRTGATGPGGGFQVGLVSR